MTNSNLTQAHQHFILGMSRIAQFWGFPKALGAIYGAIYLSRTPITMGEIVDQVGVTKGAVSTNLRQLERLGMVHLQVQLGERKNYYVAETDFWKIIRGVLQQREKSEFDLALNAVSESLVMTNAEKNEDPELQKFYTQRLQAMESFFKTLDSLVEAAIKLEGLISLSAFSKLVDKANNK